MLGRVNFTGCFIRASSLSVFVKDNQHFRSIAVKERKARDSLVTGRRTLLWLQSKVHSGKNRSLVDLEGPVNQFRGITGFGRN